MGVSPDGWEHLTRRLSERFGLDVLIEAGLVARRDTGGGYDRFRGIFLHEMAGPEEIAWWIVSAARPEASYLTGAVIRVDGGLSTGG